MDTNWDSNQYNWNSEIITWDGLLTGSKSIFVGIQKIKSSVKIKKISDKNVIFTKK